MTQPQIRIPMGIPLIGQGLAPEQARQKHQEDAFLVDLWPTNPLPRGPNTPEFWPGKTMMHEYVLKAMEILGSQLAAKTRTDDELVELCKRAWKIAYIMHKTMPLGKRPSNEPAPDATP